MPTYWRPAPGNRLREWFCWQCRLLGTAMRLAGSGYLLWLGWKIARSSRSTTGGGTGQAGSFLEGASLLWVNPKGWAMAFGAAASFGGLTRGPFHLACLLGSAFGLAAALSLSLWCLAGQLFGRVFRTERQWRVLTSLLVCCLPHQSSQSG
ncbi:LysE family translocator [Acidisphaera sp. L21]|uniref:LysE family translocator n=1 Tax=Acidisphaera sp. L21 TaxID=1641851 RepID=UPI0038D055F4